MNNKKEDWLSEFILMRGQRNSANDLLNELTNVVTKHQDAYEEFCFYLWDCSNETETILETYGVRDETDIAYKNRILEEERTKERIRQNLEEKEKKERLQRFKWYQKLKEEFEDEAKN